MATLHRNVTFSRRRAVAVVAALLASALSLGGCDSGSEVRVAFLGNSYTSTNDMPRMFGKLSAAAGIRVAHEAVALDGSSIFDMADVQLKAGRQTKKLLEDPRGWDYVVFQDQSQVPGGGKDEDHGLAPGLGRNRSLEALQAFFPPLLRRANATPVLFATWGRPNGDAYNAECCGYGDFLSMNALTTKGYQMYNDALQTTMGNVTVLTAPCGRAFERAFQAAEDALDGSCFFSRLYSAQDHWGHPSLLGSYLIANVFFGVIHGRSPRNLTWAPEGISAVDVATVQQWAHDVVFEGADFDHVLDDDHEFSVA